MSPKETDTEVPATTAPAGDLVEELAGQNLDELRRQRQEERVAVRATVILQPGNSSEARSLKAQGVTTEVSRGGCVAIFPVPIRVGDIYRLEFDQKQVDLPKLFARCLKCRWIHDEAFEGGFSFFGTGSVAPKPAAVPGEETDLFA